MNTHIKWAAELAHVREVSLLGPADLTFWRDRLRKEDLVPTERDGRAQVLIIAVEARFWGVRFHELSFAVLVSRHEEGTQQDACYLIRAFNSRRLFAMCERVFFSTPYYHGDVRLSASFPASIRLVETGEVIFQAEMQAGGFTPAREPLRCGEDGWEGAVFLPDHGRGKGRQGNVFFARIRGHTRTYPFLPSKDAMTIRPSPDSGVLQALIDSRFVAKEWAIRADALHAKSKTYKRAAVLAGRTHA